MATKSTSKVVEVSKTDGGFKNIRTITIKKNKIIELLKSLRE